jgi:hypothetical protein
LALPQAKARFADRNAQNGGWLSAAALLEAVRETELVDVEPRVSGFNRDYDVDVLQIHRQSSAQINKPLSGLAC